MEFREVFDAIYTDESFSRQDESDDTEFYQKERFVNHLDTFALGTIERLIGELTVEKDPVILDLMAGWDSHLPASLNPGKVVGLGLNRKELKENRDLNKFVIHDLNKDPNLPFGDNSFNHTVFGSENKVTFSSKISYSKHF